MIKAAAKEIAKERGFDFEELKRQTSVAPIKVTAQEGRKQLIKAIDRGDIVDTEAAIQFLIDRGLPSSNARYIVNQIQTGK